MSSSGMCMHADCIPKTSILNSLVKENQLSLLHSKHFRIQQELLEARRTGSQIKEASVRRRKVQVIIISIMMSHLLSIEFYND